MSEDREKKQFIQEQIRRKPFYRRKGFLKTVKALGMTAALGTSIGLVFAVVSPLAEKYFGEPTRMVVVKDSETEGKNSLLEIEIQQTEGNGSLLEYQQEIYEEIVETGKLVKDSVVTVMGLTSELDLFNNIDENTSRTVGVVLTEDKNGLLILTGAEVLEDVREVKVIFSNGDIADAKIQGKDSITNLAVLQVSYENLEKNTIKQVQPAVFGNSEKVQIGDGIIAVGVDYLSFGMVTSRPYLELCDGSYCRIQTDIVKSLHTGGILLNLEGQVVGILMPKSQDVVQGETVEGFGLVELLDLIEGMSNNEKGAYFGITGKEVTDALAEEFAMPQGVYVTKVIEGSPAMEKGIQAMDIISHMNGQEIRDMTDYMEILEEARPGNAVSVTLWRKVSDEYKEIKVDVTLSER